MVPATVAAIPSLSRPTVEPMALCVDLRDLPFYLFPQWPELMLE